MFMTAASSRGPRPSCVVLANRRDFARRGSVRQRNARLGIARARAVAAAPRAEDRAPRRVATARENDCFRAHKQRLFSRVFARFRAFSRRALRRAQPKRRKASRDYARSSANMREKCARAAERCHVRNESRGITLALVCAHTFRAHSRARESGTKGALEGAASERVIARAFRFRASTIFRARTFFCAQPFLAKHEC